MSQNFEFKSLTDEVDYLAPDNSEIRLLPEIERGGLAHCILPISGISKAVKHQMVDEIWYCLSGKGEIWQSQNGKGEVKEFQAMDSFTIPVGNSFQFRNLGDEPLCILIVTMPKWPGPQEAEVVEGFWK